MIFQSVSVQAVHHAAVANKDGVVVRGFNQGDGKSFEQKHIHGPKKKPHTRTQKLTQTQTDTDTHTDTHRQTQTDTHTQTDG